jgi:hypothetical protein
LHLVGYIKYTSSDARFHEHEMCLVILGMVVGEPTMMKLCSDRL